MLQNIHDKAKGWVAYAIVGFIAIPFTLFGISSYLGGGGSLVAAVVNGEEIPVSDVQNAVLQQRQRLSQMFGGKLPPGFSDDTIKQQALEQIINQELMRQESANYGYRASNQEVFEEISNIPAFQVDGKFDTATYEKLLASQRRNKAGFEAEIRESLSNQQFSQAVNKAAFLPTTETSRYRALQNQSRDVETYTLKGADFSEGITVSEADTKTYYDANTSQFMTEEKLKLSYVELKQSDIAKTVEVTDDALQAFYDENADRYTDPEQRKLAHILVKIESESEDKDEIAKAEKKAEERAKSIYDQIKAGTKTFEELAGTDSDDKFSAKKAGEIGLIALGDMGPIFEKEAFSLNKGDFSKPIKAEAGFEIIKLIDVVAKNQKSFSDVKAEIEKSYRTEEASKMFFDNSDKLQTLAFENESSLDAAADAVGLTVKTSDWVRKGGVPNAKGDLFSSPKLLAAAFGDDVLNLGKNSELIEIDETTVAVIRKQEYEKPAQKPMADVSKQINGILTQKKLREVLIEKGESALKELKETGNWTAVEAIGGSVDKLVKQDKLVRTDRKLAPTLVGKIFSMQKPEEGKTVFDNVILPEGDYVLISLKAVKDGEAKEDAALQSRFTSMLGSRERTAMLKTLREQAEVELFLENIQ